MSITYQIFQKASSYLEKYAGETFSPDAGQMLARNHSSDDPGDQEPSERRGFYARPRLRHFRLNNREY